MADPDRDRNREGANGPYEGVVSQVVAKISNEPMLFVIGVGALLIGLGALAAGLGSPDLRFLAAIIGALAFVAILGFYVVQVLPRGRGNRSVKGRVTFEQQTGGDLAGVRQSSTAATDADVQGTVKAGIVSGGRATGVEIGGAPAPPDSPVADDDPQARSPQ